MEYPTTAERQERARWWLASIVMRRESRVMARFARMYARLAERPRGWRRQLRRKLAVTVTSAALLLALAGAGANYAARADAESVITVVNGEVKIADNGKCSLIEAIRNANNQNTGQPHADCAAGNPTGADTIVLPKDGVFTLTEANNTSEEYGPNGLPWIGSVMTIEGNGSTIQRKESAPEFRILAVGPKGNLYLNEIKIQGGRIYDGSWMHDHQGGGIFNQGQLTISGSEIDSNYTYSYASCGGGISNYGELTITGSAVQNNTSSGVRVSDGGGICNWMEGTVEINNSRISGNSSAPYRYYGSGAGGGISNIGGILTITNTIISDNVAANDYASFGGGIFSSGRATITGTAFTGNKSNTIIEYDYFGYGGGISNHGIMTISNSTFSKNEANYFGGGIANFSRITIVNSSVVENIGSGIGSTCEFAYTETILQRSLVSGNSEEEIFLNNDTYCDTSGGIIANMQNVIGYSNDPRTMGFLPGPLDIIPSVPLNAIINPLADNGGPTWTHALPPGSPAIDRAPNNSCTAAPVNSVDQRGFPRNRNGAGSTSPNECDIGAFEFQPAEPPTSTPTATATATATATPTATVTPTATPSTPPTATPTGTLEPTVEPSPTPTATTGPSPTPTATATSGPSPTPPAYDWHLFVPVVAADLWN